MRFGSSLTLAMAVSLVGCDKTTADSVPPDTQTPAVASSTEPAKSAAPEDPAEAKKREQEDKKRKRAEAQRKQIEQALKERAAKYETEAKRWDDALKAKTTKLVDKRYRTTKQGLTAALRSPHREPGNAERDGFRHPLETLTFLGLKPNMTVFEVGPGEGWYTELLAPTLHPKGKLKIASYDLKSKDPMVMYFADGIDKLLGKSKELYGHVEPVFHADARKYEFGGPESLDMILVVRMTHNIVRFGGLEDFIAKAHASLKPGGILGIVQHRAPADADPKKSANMGYLPEAWVIEQFEAAGFELAAKSEINANPKDTKDYKAGVWSLPPTFALGKKDREKFEAIGESDRMTLKFVKAAK